MKWRYFVHKFVMHVLNSTHFKPCGTNVWCACGVCVRVCGVCGVHACVWCVRVCVVHVCGVCVVCVCVCVCGV